MRARFALASAVAVMLSISTTLCLAETHCTAASGKHRVPLLELYTSQGCDSCPPADRWLSELGKRGLDSKRVVAIAFHLDYWNHLGWVDPFAKAQFSQRQRAIAARNRSTFVYTPQRVLNGKDFRPAPIRDDTVARVDTLNRTVPLADVGLAMSTSGNRLEIDLRASVAAPAQRADVYLALVEDGLETVVRAGENRGRTLKHDHVVRTLLGPFPISPASPLATRQTFDVQSNWRAERTSVVAFVEDPRTGEILQSLALPRCKSAG